MKEPLGEYITRKRLEGAAIKLAYSSNPKILNIALEYGYSSLSSFSKAFNQWFGYRPSQIAKIKQSLNSGNETLQTKCEKSIDSRGIFVSPSRKKWEDTHKKIDSRVDIRSISGFDLYYLISPDGYNFSSVSRIWKKLIESLEDRNININECDRFSLCHDHPGLSPSSKCRYEACIALPKKCNIKLSLGRTKIPSGRYAVFPIEGTKESILDQCLEFYTVWMPQSGYELDNFPSIERYISPFSRKNIKVELWAKIKCSLI